MATPFNNPVFGIDNAGAFGGIGDSLASNSFGGASLNVGGFGGSAPGYSGFGGNMNKAAGILGLANMGLGIMGMSNTAQSFNSMQNLGGIMRDLDFDTNIFAQNKDIFEQKDAPRWAAKFRVNDPFYRQYESRANLPELAGKYGRFGAFIA
jgi:hypothetical protein